MLSVDTSALIVFILVWILVIILSKVFFKPLRRVMKDRASRLEGDREAGQRALAAIDDNLNKIEEALKTAGANAAALKGDLELEALKEKSRLIAEINEENRCRVDEAKQQLDKQVQRLKKDLEAEAAVLSQKIEQRLLQ
jgi:F-type H+-transporting ATPase subunit b